MISKDPLTVRINQWINGDKSQENSLIEEIYPAIRSIAKNQLNKVKNSDLNTTLLVNEAYLKLIQINRLKISNKNHFMALCAQTIRRLILDNFRSNQSKKRGGGLNQVTIERLNSVINDDKRMDIDLMTLHELLIELEMVDELSAKIIEMRFYAGMNIKQIADVCDSSERSINRRWAFAKSWLHNKFTNL